MGTVVGSPIYYNDHVRQLLQLIRVIITNANERTATEVSEITGIKPEYVDIPTNPDREPEKINRFPCYGTELIISVSTVS